VAILINQNLEIKSRLNACYRSVKSLYNRHGKIVWSRKYKRLKLGGGQAYDRSSE
jgi:hypothetical protein